MALDERAKQELNTHLDAVAALIKVQANDEDAREIAEGMRAKLQPVYQIAFRGGLQKGKDDAKAANEQLAADKTRLEGELAAANTKLSEQDKKTPDVAALRAEKDGEIARLKEQHKREMEVERAAHAEESLNVAREQVKGFLVTAYGVDALAAEYVVNGPAFKSKLKRENGAWSVLDESGTAVQLDAKVKPLDHLAKTLADTVDPKFRSSNVEPGGGTRSEKGGKGTGSATKWDAIRNDVKEEQENRSNPADLGARLTGGRRTAGTGRAVD